LDVVGQAGRYVVEHVSGRPAKCLNVVGQTGKRLERGRAGRQKVMADEVRLGIRLESRWRHL